MPPRMCGGAASCRWCCWWASWRSWSACGWASDAPAAVVHVSPAQNAETGAGDEGRGGADEHVRGGRDGSVSEYEAEAPGAGRRDLPGGRERVESDTDGQ